MTQSTTSPPPAPARPPAALAADSHRPGLGVAAGMAFGADAQLLAPIGTLFLNAIKMLIVPLVFVSLVAGITRCRTAPSLAASVSKPSPSIW